MSERQLMQPQPSVAERQDEEPNRGKKANAHAKRRKIILLTVRYVLLSVFGFLMVYPLIFMFMAGFYTKEEYWSAPLKLFPIASSPTLKNYLALFNLGAFPGIGTYFLNSFLRTLYGTLMTVITTMVCSYVFARLKFRGKNTIFLVLLFCSMLPGTITLLPTYMMYANWPSAKPDGILDTWWVYLIGGPGINVMATFIAKQYLEGIPEALDESAKIDGANVFQIMFLIIFPVAKPVFGYIIITTALGIWNDWSTSFFYTSSDKLQVLPSAISKLSIGNNVGMPDYPLMITLGLAVTIPALVIYLIFQKNIVEGIATVGIKG